MTTNLNDITVRPDRVSGVVRYFANLTRGRFILWCYFAYWATVVVHYRDAATPRLWFTALGLSAIIGFALYLNTTRSGPVPVKLGFWPTFRLFLTPFCVSSFAALVKDKGFLLIFPGNPHDFFVDFGITVAVGALLWCTMWYARRVMRSTSRPVGFPGGTS